MADWLSSWQGLLQSWFKTIRGSLWVFVFLIFLSTKFRWLSDLELYNDVFPFIVFFGGETCFSCAGPCSVFDIFLMLYVICVSVIRWILWIFFAGTRWELILRYSIWIECVLINLDFHDFCLFIYTNLKHFHNF